MVRPLIMSTNSDFCMHAAQTIFFIIFKISPAYASWRGNIFLWKWRVTLLLVLFCHVVQNSVLFASLSEKNCYTSWSISRWYFKFFKKIVCAACIQKSLLAHQRSMMLGPNRKHRQVTNLDNTLCISKQAVGHSVPQLKS